MSKNLDLANQQFLGYFNGKWRQLIGMVEAMGLTAKEWEKLKSDYSLYLDEDDIEEVNQFFESKT